MNGIKSNNKSIAFKISNKIAKYFFENRTLYEFIETIEKLFGVEFMSKATIRKYMVSRIKNSWTRYRRLWK